MRRTSTTERLAPLLAGRLHGAIHKWLLEELAAAGAVGLVPSHGDALGLLFAHGSATMHELAAFARRTKPTTTVLVDKLERLGYVRREASPGDARCTVVRLTPAGEALRPVFEDVNRRFLARFYAGFSPEESAALESLLAKALANFAPTDNTKQQEKHP